VSVLSVLSAIKQVSIEEAYVSANDEDQTDELDLADPAVLEAAWAAAMTRAPRMSELELQVAIVELAEERLGLWVFRVPSSARTGIGRVAKTARGWPDLTIGSRRTGRMLFRECKSEYGETSAEQQEWLSMLHRNGCDQGIWRPEDWESGRIRAELEALG
jgi:hypothetical protein